MSEDQANKRRRTLSVLAGLLCDVEPLPNLSLPIFGGVVTFFQPLNLTSACTAGIIAQHEEEKMALDEISAITAIPTPVSQSATERFIDLLDQSDWHFYSCFKMTKDLFWQIVKVNTARSMMLYA